MMPGMNSLLPKLPLGISDFGYLREANVPYLYVDKTRLLPELLNAGKYLFLTRPRRFGKSLICSTLKYLYEGRRDLFQGLAIEPTWDWTQKYPVVFLSLATLGNATPEKLTANLTAWLRDQAETYGVDLSGKDMPDCFVAFLAAVHAHTGRRVVVIVDEYEKPVHDHIENGILAGQMRDVLASFYGALKGCDAVVEKVFITGVGRMVKTSIFSALNQMKDVTLHEAAAELCGYTEGELSRYFEPFVSALAQRHALTFEQARQTIRDRYNGYGWGKGERVYNPWAILNCLDDREFGSYWWESGTPSMLLKLADNLERPDGDMEGLVLAEKDLLFDLADPRPEPLLWQAGYLTIRETDGAMYTLGFPNTEVREAWFGLMLNRFRGKPGGARGHTTAAIMLNALSKGDRPRFEQALAALFASIPGELHLGKEAFYHAVFIAALQATGGRLIPESRSDKGRADAVLETRDLIYLIEFKLGSAEEALAQIKARRYYEPYLADPRKLVLLGAGGFAEKNIRCLWEDVTR